MHKMSRSSLDIAHFYNQRQAELYICPICFSVPHPFSAVEHQDCGKIFCAPCLGEWLKGNHSTCPNCRRLMKVVKLGLALTNTMLSLLIRCPYAPPQLCIWQGEWDNLPSHEEECPYAPLECPNECGQWIRKPDLQKHVKSCSIRTIIRESMRKTLDGQRYDGPKGADYAGKIVANILEELCKMNNDMSWGVAVVLAEGQGASCWSSTEIYCAEYDVHLYESYENDNKDWLGLAFIFMYDRQKRDRPCDTSSFNVLANSVKVTIREILQNCLDIIGKYSGETALAYCKFVTTSIKDTLWELLGQFVYGVNVFFAPKTTHGCFTWAGNYIVEHDGTVSVFHENKDCWCYVVIQGFKWIQLTIYCKEIIQTLYNAVFFVTTIRLGFWKCHYQPLDSQVEISGFIMKLCKLYLQFDSVLQK
eukprot:TRINITY_DN797_c0_g1_i2.p1 TRINITY_DN797_c0_g1~~TRINITY_DN797_c0_g1_i2.p1  ORF type:complete len:460 (-),score=8.25 TRINITY_DN797_c0_g1_i2:90-1343(-)